MQQPLPLPVGVSDMAVGSEPEIIWLLMAVFLIGAVMFVRWRGVKLVGAGGRWSVGELGEEAPEEPNVYS
jgi:hypothetical protein